MMVLKVNLMAYNVNTIVVAITHTIVQLRITAPTVNCHQGIEGLWPKYHGLVKQGLIIITLSCKDLVK